MTHRIGVGIHGAGNVSTEYIRAFMRNPDTEVRMITSRTLDSARRRAAACGVDCDVGDDFEAMLRRDDVQIVAICTPNQLHTAEGIQAARAGKHFVIEKPIALSLSELRDLLVAVREAGVKTTVGFVLRWHPLIELARRLAHDGTLGSLVLVTGGYIHHIDSSRPGWDWKRRRESSGGAMLFAGCHAVDTLRHCAGEITEVTAWAAQVSRREFDYPPTIAASLRFASGAVGTICVTFEAYSPYVFNLELYGTRGSLRNNQLFTHGLRGQTGYATIPINLPGSGEVSHHPFQAEVDEFVACIREDRDSRTTVADAARTHEVCLAIDRSAEGGRPVALPLEG
jgi:UDP-N-acetyl-2-amino-2-deoxyglucuronate dehydrogenase